MTYLATIKCGGSGCAALKKDGTVVGWGHSNFVVGASSTSNSSSPEFSSIARIDCGDYACVGLQIPSAYTVSPTATPTRIPTAPTKSPTSAPTEVYNGALLPISHHNLIWTLFTAFLLF